MIEVNFLGPIKKEKILLDIKNLKELQEILSKDDSLKEWIKLCAVSLNDKIINSLDIDLKDGDKIALLPPVCGG